MFLIRTAFWLSLVVLLLPTDARQQAKLYTAASDAAHHAATTCERHRDLCAKGAEHWVTFKQKLEFGTRLAIDLATERLAGTASAQPVRTLVQPAAGTLTPADLQPAWRVRPARTGA